MRTDSQNLLDRLDQPDFHYQEFQSAEEARRGHGWPLLDMVARAVAGRRHHPAPVSVTPPPAPAPVPVTPHAPEPAPAPARSFFARYGETPGAAPAEGHRQPGDL